MCADDSAASATNDYSDDADGDRAAADGDNAAPNFTSTDDHHSVFSTGLTTTALVVDNDTTIFSSSAVVNRAIAAACFSASVALSISSSGDDLLVRGAPAEGEAEACLAVVNARELTAAVASVPCEHTAL